MIPVNIFSKLARSRSQVAIARRTFVASGTLWNQKQGGQKGGDEHPVDKREEPQSCGSRNAGSKHLGEHDIRKQKKCSLSPGEHSNLEKKKQGEASQCGTIQSHETRNKPISSEGDGYTEGKHGSQSQKPRGCSCPPYATPKHSDENYLKNKTSCSSKNVSGPSKLEKTKCEPVQSKVDPCESKKGRIQKEEDKCENSKIKDRCETEPSRKDLGPSEKNTCSGEGAQKRGNYCGPMETSYKDECREEKDKGDRDYRARRTECEDPCKTSKPSSRGKEECPDVCEKKTDHCDDVKSSPSDCLKPENKCDERNDPCRPGTARSSNLCPDKCEQENIKTEFRLDPCGADRKDDCCEEVCDEKVEKACPEGCKKEIKIPELSSCCKLESAKECICKLKDLQRQWEEVIAAQEGGGKDECEKPRQSSDCQEPTKREQREHKRSNMIYVVLSAILAAVAYYTYQGDFEPEELFMEDEEVKKDDNNDDD